MLELLQDGTGCQLQPYYLHHVLFPFCNKNNNSMRFKIKVKLLTITKEKNANG